MTKNRTKKDEFRQPINLITGSQEDAVYKKQLLPEYENNPLIEALPQIIQELPDVTKSLAYFPDYSDEVRNLPAGVRLHALDNAREFFLPNQNHLELHYSISNMIRRSYIARNPIELGYWNHHEQKMNSLKDSIDPQKKMKPRRTSSRSKPRGLAIIGGGGNGKSTAVENDLNLYPQVIIHTKYKNKPFILKQLVWLKIDSPQDGSIKGLCQEFFQIVDEVLETTYYAQYGDSHRSVDVMLLDMARVAAMHSLGVLVIDETQDLSLAKSGGAAKILNFFVHLENKIGVPYVLIGTENVENIFTDEFRQARRASEQGDFDWKRMKMIADDDNEDMENDKANNLPALPDPIWDDFVRTLFSYQYTHKVHKLPENILDDKVVETLYNLSQGVPAIAHTLYFLAQKRAITSGKEELTVQIIKSAEKDRLNLVRKGIDRMRLGNEINMFGEKDLSVSKHFATQHAKNSSKRRHASEVSDENSADQEIQGHDVDIKESSVSVKDSCDETSENVKNKKPKKQSLGKKGAPKDLKVVTDTQSYIKPADEFLQ